jgi:hypothetical protein
MKNIFALSTIALLITACGGGGSAGTITPPVSANYCDVNQQVLSKINTAPIYTFRGLTSSWANQDSVPGAREGEWFTIAVIHASTVASKTNDIELKKNIVDNLYIWANADAYTGTYKCYVASKPFNGGTAAWNPVCTQWTVDAGTDLSAIQDGNYVGEKVNAIRRAYALISPWAKVQEPAKHARIKQWLDYWIEYTPQANDVYFGMGMGRYHHQMQIAEDNGNLAEAKNLATRLMAGIVPLVKADGSIVDRTTRGDRGLWYHYASLNEITTSVHLAKRYGATVPAELEKNLHTAISLFLNTLDNPAYILPWASIGHNNGGDGTNQNFNFSTWFDDPYGGNWIYLYARWYPDHENTKRLQAKVPYGNAKSEALDIQFGEGLGCTTS